ncbi:class I SAM-dependent methyltransferase [Mariniflexile sp.]|uniref:class I SAM-dependent methyltransferase n=1 Tax=Mariniflexile sp. TaxID=1979402 RepID=UPI004048D89F
MGDNLSNKKSGFSEHYEKKVVENWIGRSSINKVEEYLFSKYINNNKLKVIDAGTAAGIFSFYLEEKSGFKNITAFDIIDEMIVTAKAKAVQKQSTITFVQADASNLNNFDGGQFDYLIYLQQILSMVPKELLNKSLEEAYRIGSKDAVYIFSFLDWNSRWYNPIVSMVINLVRPITGRKIKKYYLPELLLGKSINKNFFSKEHHGILWVKKKHILKKLNACGFKVSAYYREEDLTKATGRAMYIICKKK